MPGHRVLGKGITGGDFIKASGFIKNGEDNRALERKIAREGMLLKQQVLHRVARIMGL